MDLFLLSIYLLTDFVSWLDVVAATFSLSGVVSLENGFEAVFANADGWFGGGGTVTLAIKVSMSLR